MASLNELLVQNPTAVLAILVVTILLLVYFVFMWWGASSKLEQSAKTSSYRNYNTGALPKPFLGGGLEAPIGAASAPVPDVHMSGMCPSGQAPRVDSRGSFIGCMDAAGNFKPGGVVRPLANLDCAGLSKDAAAATEEAHALAKINGGRYGAGVSAALTGK